MLAVPILVTIERRVESKEGLMVLWRIAAFIRLLADAAYLARVRHTRRHGRRLAAPLLLLLLLTRFAKW